MKVSRGRDDAPNRRLLNSVLVPRLRSTLVAGAALFGLALPARAQDKREINGLTLNGIPHPVAVALTYYDSLRLSETQVKALQRATAHASEVLSARYMRELQDTTQLLRFWRPGPIDSGAVRRWALSTLDADVNVELELLRLRDETFRILTAEQRAQIATIIRQRIAAPRIGPPGSAPRETCDGGGQGGGMRLSDRVQLTYSARFVGDSARLMVFVGRADSTLDGLLSPGPRPVGVPSSVSGATIGRWWMVFEWSRNVAWIDTTRIDLGGRNVVLVQGVDRVTRPPEVVGLVAGASMVHTGRCRNSDFSDVLRRYVLALPEVRAFIEGKR